MAAPPPFPNDTAPTTTFGDYRLTAYANEGRNEWSVEAYTGRNWTKVAEAQFAGVYRHRTPRKPSGQLVALKGWDVEVDPRHRRKGLASAMYRFAGEAFTLPIEPGDFQTAEGAAFLASLR